MLTLSQGTRTARKQHHCNNCTRPIQPGEQYEWQSNIGDDGLYTWKSCGQCQAVADWIYTTDPYSVDPDYGLDLGEWLREYPYSPELERQFRDKWRNGTSVIPVAEIAFPVTEKSAP